MEIILTSIASNSIQSIYVRKVIACWLFVVCLMILFMVTIGGLTRLTHSGLSMAYWQPLTGWLPPLTDIEWGRVFSLYQNTPEYKQLNFGINLDEFKSIFWLEYIHRLWGRVIGVAFIVPFIYFLVRGYLDRSLIYRLLILLLLGITQSFMGWFMVKSGLIDKPDVSQYRLSIHLGLAIILYVFMLSLAIDLLKIKKATPTSNSSRILNLSIFSGILIFVTMLGGGLVAGLDAGSTYNTFPLMDGKFIPDGMFRDVPIYINFFENVTSVQFNHRWLGKLSLISCLSLWCLSRGKLPSTASRNPFNMLAVLIVCQFSLGVATLLFVVPVFLALAHQILAFFCLSALVWCCHAISTTKVKS